MTAALALLQAGAAGYALAELVALIREYRRG